MTIGYDGLEAGVLYAVGQGPPQKYTGVACPYGTICRENCVLFNNGKCEYKLSLRGEMYRELDNRVLFQSSPLTSRGIEPLVKTSAGRTEGALEEGDCVASPKEPLLPNTSKLDADLKQYLEKLGGNEK